LFSIGAAFLLACQPRITPSLLADAENAAVVHGSGSSLDVVFLPYTDEMAQRTFGLKVWSKGILALELKLARATEATDRLKVRRSGVHASFVDGAERDAVDPRKVYEGIRVNRAPAVLFFGRLGGAMAAHEDSRRERVLLDSSFSLATLDDRQREVAGLVFFDVDGIQPSSLKSLEIEFENSSTATLHQVRIDVPRP
jgi:hypothetical protein